jgi:tetratricopeptide (TPR) repeat protein
MKALEKDRARRYETANGLARDVQRYLADEPVEACPPSAGYRLRKFARKNRGALATVATLALLLVAGVAISMWQAVRAIRAEQAAIEERNRARLSDQEAREERDRVVAEKKRADENLALARKAVEDYLTRVTDDPELKDRTDFTSLRKRLLESALPFYQHFALQLGDKPESRAESGRILMRLAQVQIESGSLNEAVKSLRQARDVYTHAVADSPGTFLYRSALVETTRKLAYWEFRVQEVAASRQDYGEAIRLADRLVADFPKEPELRFVRAIVLTDSMYFGRDRSEEVLHELRDLVHEHPGNIRYQTSLAIALDNSASTLQQARRWQDAEAAYRESVAIQREIFESQPKDPGRRHNLANELFNYGAFVYTRNRPSEALPLRQEAGKLLRQLVQDFSSNVRFRHMLARNQNAVGLLLAEVNRQGDAVPALREAVLLMEQLPETYPHPAVRRWRLADFTKDLAVVLDSLDRWDEASSHADRAIRLLTEAPSLFKAEESRGNASQSLVESLRLRIRGSERHGRAAEARKKLEEVRADLRSRNEAEMLLAVALYTVREGWHQDATTDAEAVVAMRPTEANQLYDAACVFSLASGRVRSDADQAERYAKRALELLQRSVAAGFQNIEHLKKDDDLVPLRDRRDYKGFVADVDKKLPPRQREGHPK